MNEKAAELGLQSTSYADPSGLLSENVSSAYDMARLITHASGDERIASIMRTPEYTVYTAKRAITFHSTNHLLGRDDVDVRAGKTGFISKAGYCLATLLRLPDGGQQVAVVVLGARSNAGRFMETQNLFNWLSAKASTIFATKTPASLSRTAKQNLELETRAQELSFLVASPFSSKFSARSSDVAALHRGRVERQRGDRIDRHHDRARVAWRASYAFR